MEEQYENDMQIPSWNDNKNKESPQIDKGICRSNYTIANNRSQNYNNQALLGGAMEENTTHCRVG